MLTLPIYMDNHATTRTDPRVVEAMLPYFTERYGNAASRNHVFGWQADEAVEEARAQVANLIGAEAKEIIFTSGATESDNLALKGVANLYRRQGNHLITAQTEHRAVLDPCKRLQREGFDFSAMDALTPAAKNTVERWKQTQLAALEKERRDRFSAVAKDPALYASEKARIEASARAGAAR